MNRFFLILIFSAVIGCGRVYIPHAGRLGSNSSKQEDYLREIVHVLSEEIGERNGFHPKAQRTAQNYIVEELSKLGLHVELQPVKSNQTPERYSYNIIASKMGSEPALAALVVGAHYDSKVATNSWKSHGPPLPDQKGTPGANDNASGVAAVLAAAKHLAQARLARTIKFVLFTNEEPPFLKSNEMGSRVFTSQLRESGIPVFGAIIFDCVGVFSNRSLNKRALFWPFPAVVGLPLKSDYIAFLTNFNSAEFTFKSAQVLQAYLPFEVRAMSYPELFGNVAWSDDWSFWQEDIPAFTITDTAFLRSDDYHELTDTAATIDYPKFAELVRASVKLIEQLSNTASATI